MIVFSSSAENGHKRRLRPCRFHLGVLHLLGSLLELGVSFSLSRLRKRLSGVSCLLCCITRGLSDLSGLFSGVTRVDCVQELDVGFLDGRDELLYLRS